MGTISNLSIEKMQKLRSRVLLQYIVSYITKGDINKGLEILYGSMTFSYLQNKETDFYWKSEEELIYLLQMELEGNTEEWNLYSLN